MTQTTASSPVYSTSRTLYMAMEISQKDWKLAFAQGFEPPRLRNVRAGDFGALVREVSKAKKRCNLEEDTPVASCYEAGRDAFWIHRELERLGYRNVVVDPASIEVERRRRKRKTDRLDVLGLMSRLVRSAQGEMEVWKTVRVPSVEQEDQRRLHRERCRLQKERIAHLARLRSLLATQGPVPKKLDERTLRLHSRTQEQLPPFLVAELQREWARLELLNQQLREVERTMAEEEKKPTQAMEKVRALKKFKGIGSIFARVVVTEFFGWRQFKNRREVGSLSGMTGTPYNSGASDREQGISKAGNRWVRSLSVEIAWLWIRHQPDSAITRWYLERFGERQRARKVGIVAVARRVLVALWKYLEFGEVPDGAIIQASD